MNINESFRYLNIGLPEDIRRRKLHGDFQGAIRLIDRQLAQENTTPAMRACLTAQREMINRLPIDFTLTKAQALELARESIPDFSEEEFDTLVDNRRILWIYIDGEMRFLGRFFATLCKTEPSIAKRAGIKMPGAESEQGDEEEETYTDRCIRVMKEKGSMTNRYRIRAGMKVKDEAFKKGMFIRAHLPIPAACDQQKDIVIEEVYPPTAKIAPEDAPQRTVCWEENMEENHEFYVEYSYTHTAVYHDTTKLHGDVEQPDFYTNEEAPHILFTPYIRNLVETLTAGITDPLEKARRFYDFITLNMKYNFMPAYFVMESISENCARNYTGDCGVFALLFLTLCRCAGIPACWQSGLAAEPEFCGAHDWVRFYVAPHGWLYADTSYGVSAVRMGNEERRKFYFGNLDVYRMVANREFQAPFTIDKEHWRCDPYDNQVGEMETDDHGLLYSEFDRTKVMVCHEEL